MSSTGSPANPADDLASVADAPETSPPTLRERVTGALTLIGVAALILFALIAGFHIVSILYGVIYPPVPPVYDPMTQVSHESEEHGVDTWRYVTKSSPDAIAAFYTDHGADCNVRGPGVSQEIRVAVTCDGVTTFSIFSMSYEVVVTPEQANSVVRLSREVFWIGSPPAPQ